MNMNMREDLELARREALIRQNLEKLNGLAPQLIQALRQCLSSLETCQHLLKRDGYYLPDYIDQSIQTARKFVDPWNKE